MPFKFYQMCNINTEYEYRPDAFDKGIIDMGDLAYCVAITLAPCQINNWKLTFR